MAFGRRRREDPRVDLTPMVDVVFLLLIFFMISTTFIETPGLTIDLPKSSQQQTQNKTEEVRVYLAADSSLYLEQKKVSFDELLAALTAYGDAAANTTFLLMADKEVKHGQVVQLMDSAKAAGFTKLSIATEKK